MKIESLIAELEKFAPPSLAEEWDRVGLMVGDSSRECTGVMLALDLVDEVIDEAIAGGANLIVTHHPFIWDPIRRLDVKDAMGRLIARLIANDITVYSMHTNLDKAALCKHVASLLSDDVKADEEGIGAIASFEGIALKDLAKKVSHELGDPTVRLVGDPMRKVFSAYVVTGSGSGEYDRAKQVADVLVAGELKHSVYIDAARCGYMLIEYSHYYSEIVMQDVLYAALQGTGIKIIRAAKRCPFRRIEEV